MDNEILVLESYFGKTQTLQECEVILDKIIKIIRKNPKAKIIGSSLNRKLESLFEKQFGFKKVCINFSLDNIVYDLISGGHVDGPCTYPSCTAFFDPKCRLDSTVGSKNGYYDKNHEHVIDINVPIEFLFTADWTGAELLGIILHEIGHNFEMSPYRLVYEVSKLYLEFYTVILFSDAYTYMKQVKDGSKIMMRSFIDTMVKELRLIAGNTEFIKKTANKFNILWDNFTSQFPLYRTIRVVLAKAMQYIYMVDSILSIKSVFTEFIKLYNFSNPDNLSKFFFTVITRKSEKFADSFVATYGYSAEYVSAMEKLSKTTAAPLSKNKTLMKKCSILRDILISKYTLLNAFSIPSHGSGVERSQYNINHLKKELKSADLRPEVREQIEKDILQSEKILSDWLKRNDDEKLVINGYLQKFILNVFGDDAFLIEKMFPDVRA